MKWIASEGGPLILLPTSYVTSWHGGFGGVAGVTDYDLACQIDGSLGVIHRDNTDLLVLGDEPAQTAFIHIDEFPRFIRWIYAPSQGSVESCLRDQISRLDDAIEEIQYTVHEEDLFLIDAAAEGAGPRDVLAVRLAQGKYTVRTYWDKPNKNIWLVVHVFDLVDRCGSHARS